MQPAGVQASAIQVPLSSIGVVIVVVAVVGVIVVLVVLLVVEQCWLKLVVTEP